VKELKKAANVSKPEYSTGNFISMGRQFENAQIFHESSQAFIRKDQRVRCKVKKIQIQKICNHAHITM